jgi:hypothetical protein
VKVELRKDFSRHYTITYNVPLDDSKVRHDEKKWRGERVRYVESSVLLIPWNSGKHRLRACVVPGSPSTVIASARLPCTVTKRR